MKKHIVSRRSFLRVGALGGLACARPALGQPGGAVRRESRALPLGQDYTVAVQVPEKGLFVHDPAMTILPNGKFVVAAPIWRRPARPAERNKYVVVTRSDDKGRTWRPLCEKPWAEAALFVHENRLYMFTRHAPWP